MDDFLSKPLEELAGKSFNCECNKTHKVDIKNILLGKGVVDKLEPMLEPFKGKDILLVSDINTFELLGDKVSKIIEGQGNLFNFTFQEKHLKANERSIGTLLMELPAKLSLIVTIGSGTLNDISRYISYKMNVPYIIICTAPSMDGYASVVSPLIRNGIKKTYQGVYPYAIIADIAIMKMAPMHMLYAGLGDVLGKFTALCDWRLSKLLTGEYLCETIFKQVEKAIDKCIEAAPKLKERDEEAIYTICESLILSGLCIGMANSSRPASGGEHLLAHSWEIVFMAEGRDGKFLHGNYVGAALGVVLETYHLLESIDIEEVYRSNIYKNLNKDKWESGISSLFSECYKDIILFKEKNICFNMVEREKNMENIKNNWKEIINIAKKAPKTKYIKAILEEAGSNFYPSDLGVNKELLYKSIIGAKDIRNRYVIFQLLEDIGMLDYIATEIVEGDLFSS